MIPEAAEARLTPADRAVLEARVRAPTTEQRDVFRARIILLAAEGRSTRASTAFSELINASIIAGDGVRFIFFNEDFALPQTTRLHTLGAEWYMANTPEGRDRARVLKWYASTTKSCHGSGNRCARLTTSGNGVSHRMI